MMSAPVEKLRKLRARATRRDGHEAINAGVRLRELLERCGLTEADLDDAEAKDAIADEQADWNKERLAHAVARARSCVAMAGHGQLIFRGRARHTRAAAHLYKAFVDVATANATLHGSPPAVLSVFVRVFWAVFTDCAIARLTLSAQAQAQAVAETVMSAAVDAQAAAKADPKGASIAERIAADRAAFRAAQEAMLESLGVEGLDPYEAAVRVEAAAVSRAQKAAALVSIDDPPTWGHEPVVIRGHLTGPSDRFRTMFCIDEDGAEYKDEQSK